MKWIGQIVFALPSWTLQRWIARRIGIWSEHNGGWMIGPRVLIFDKLDED